MDNTTQPHNGGGSDSDYLVVGGGTMGSSIALALKREEPEARIVWYAGIDRSTASRDKTKIVRTQYPLKGYIDLAKEAMKKWETDEYANFFHKSGWIQVFNEGSDRKLMLDSNDQMISSEEMLTLTGSREMPDLERDERLYFNGNVGFVDNDEAVSAVSKIAVELGVKRYDEDITKLVVEDGLCTGAEVSGNKIIAVNTIVAAGPWTPGILRNSRIEFPDGVLDVVAIGVASMSFKNQAIVSESMPILVTDEGEIMLSDGGLKITSTKSFSIGHPDDLAGRDVNIDANRVLLERLLPQYKGADLEGWHCVDLVTPYQHPLIDQVPNTPKLYLAVGGSFHWAKFLPLGSAMVHVVKQRMNGQANPGNALEKWLFEKCGWDRTENELGAHGNLVPKVNCDY